MIATEFLNEFRKTQNAFVWKYIQDNRIRGFLKSGDIGEAFDPISATLIICDRADGQNTEPGQLLGLSAADIEAVNDAADGRIWKSVDGELVLDGYIAWLRDEIVAAADLEPEDLPQFTPSPATVTALTSSIETAPETAPQHV